MVEAVIPNKLSSEKRLEKGAELASEFIDTHLIPASRSLAKMGTGYKLGDVLFVLYRDFVEEKQVEGVFERSDIAFVLQTRATEHDNKKVPDVSSIKKEHKNQASNISDLQKQIRSWLDEKAMIEEGNQAWNTPAPGRGELEIMEERIRKIRKSVKENKWKGLRGLQEKRGNKKALMKSLDIKDDKELVERLIS